MAFRMKHWIGVTLTGMALVAAWRLPPEPQFYERDAKSAEQIRYEELSAEKRAVSETLFRIFWSDSLSARVVAEAENGVAVLLPEGIGAPEQRERLTERIRRQFDERTDGDAAMTFGFVIQPHNHRSEDGALSSRPRSETYVGTRDGVDYCLQVRVAQRGTEHAALGRLLAGADYTPPVSDELGSCRYFAVYGHPGERIRDWLEGGGLEFAYEDGEMAEEERPNYSGRRGAFGFAALTAMDAELRVSRCTAGVAEACADFFEHVRSSAILSESELEWAQRSAAIGLGSLYRFRRLFVDQSYVLADLEEEFGREAFERFWTSDEDMGAAFEDAFGHAPGEWFVSWLDRSQGIDPPGPGLPRQASTGAMVTFGLLLGIAYWRRRERTIVS